MLAASLQSVALTLAQRAAASTPCCNPSWVLSSILHLHFAINADPNVHGGNNHENKDRSDEGKLDRGDAPGPIRVSAHESAERVLHRRCYLPQQEVRHGYSVTHSTSFAVDEP